MSTDPLVSPPLTQVCGQMGDDFLMVRRELRTSQRLSYRETYRASDSTLRGCRHGSRPRSDRDVHAFERIRRPKLDPRRKEMSA